MTLVETSAQGTETPPEATSKWNKLKSYFLASQAKQKTNPTPLNSFTYWNHQLNTKLNDVSQLKLTQVKFQVSDLTSVTKCGNEKNKYFCSKTSLFKPQHWGSIPEAQLNPNRPDYGAAPLEEFSFWLCRCDWCGWFSASTITVIDHAANVDGEFNPERHIHSYSHKKLKKSGHEFGCILFGYVDFSFSKNEGPTYNINH